MNNDTFDITVVIPAYNSEKWIERAIESVLDQTVKPFEIIVVDDGSTDSTAEIVGEYGDCVRYIYQENAGAGAARNKGIEQAKGNWIAFLDADDQWYPHKLESQIAILRHYGGLKWCGCSFNIHAASGFQQLHISYHSKRELERYGFFPSALRAARRDSPFHTSGMLIHRCVFDKVGLFDASLRQAQDNDMWRRISMCFISIGFCPNPCHIYNANVPGSVAKGDESIPCNFKSLAKTAKIAREQSADVQFEFFRLARAMAFRRLVSLPFKRPDLIESTYREYLRIIPLSTLSIFILKFIRLLPTTLGRKIECRIREINHLWNRWF